MKRQSSPYPSWRNRWIVRNVLSELAVIGFFFKTANTCKAGESAVKSIFMILSGVVLIMGKLISIELDEKPEMQALQLAGRMALGSTLGALVFNSIFFLGKRACDEIYHCCNQSQHDEENPLIDSSRLDIKVNF